MMNREEEEEVQEEAEAMKRKVYHAPFRFPLTTPRPWRFQSPTLHWPAKKEKFKMGTKKHSRSA